MDMRPEQLPLPWTTGPSAGYRAGALRTKEAVLEAIKAAIKNCPMDRESVAAELSRLVGEEFSVHSLNNIFSVSEGKATRRFPLEFVKAITVITGDLGIIRAAIGPEFDAIDDMGKATLEYGAIMLRGKAMSRRRRSLEERALSQYAGG